MNETPWPAGWCSKRAMSFPITGFGRRVGDEVQRRPGLASLCGAARAAEQDGKDQSERRRISASSGGSFLWIAYRFSRYWRALIIAISRSRSRKSELSALCVRRSASVVCSRTPRICVRSSSQTSRSPVGRAVVLELVRPHAAHGGDRPLELADDVGDRDLLRRPRELVAAFGAALARDQAAAAELGEDALEELRRDASAPTRAARPSSGRAAPRRAPPSRGARSRPWPRPAWPHSS